MSDQDARDAKPPKGVAASFFKLCIGALGLMILGLLLARGGAAAGLDDYLAVISVAAVVTAIAACYIAIRAAERV